MGLTKLLASVRLCPSSASSSKLVRRHCCHHHQDPHLEDCHAAEGNLDGNKKGLILGVYEVNKKYELTVAAEEFNQKYDGILTKHLNELSCQLKLGRALVVSGVSAEYSAVALACLGPRHPGYDELEALDLTKENIRWGVGAGVRALQARCCAHIDVDDAGAADAAAEAAELAAWRFQEFKTTSSRTVVPCVAALGGESHAWAVGASRGRAQNWARYLADMPANMMTPVDLAQHALDMLCPLGVTVEARDRDWIVSQNMQAFLAVSRGSCSEPMFLECSYNGGPASGAPVLLAAKGVTFDSGGMCLKRCSSMTENRGSMAGAAVVLGAIKTLAEMKVPVNIRAVIPICENMISGQCMKVGDVVRALNSLSIQIENTDMEGRLMLADALVYGQATHKPALVIDVATLTHGVKQATGGGAFGCFSNSEAAWGAVRAAGAITGDRPWRFPLWRYYRNQIVNDPSVDLRNKGSGKATPCLGAAFLKHFVCNDWVHMDITGVGKLAHDAPPYLHPRRMTGRPTRTLALLLETIASGGAERSTPGTCHHPPGTCHHTPGTCHHTPGTCHPTPETCHHTPGACHHTPGTCHPTPETCHHTPGACHHTPGACHHTPGTCHHTPGTCHHTPGTCHHTPGTCHHTPGTCHHTPGTCHHTPGTCHHTPGTCTPGTKHDDCCDH